LSGFLESITESPAAKLASGTPLDLLPPRQKVILLARAARVSMTELAKLFTSRCECGRTPHLSRQTVYQEIRSAWRALKRVPPCRSCREAPAEPGRLVCRGCRTAPGVRRTPTSGGER